MHRPAFHRCGTRSAARSNTTNHVGIPTVVAAKLLVHSLLHAFGGGIGKIQLASVPGEGNRFEPSLPLAAPHVIA